MARQSIGEFLQDHDMDIYLAVFDKPSFPIGKALGGKVEHYIDHHYVDAHTAARGRLLQVEEDALADVLAHFRPAPSLPEAVSVPALPQGLDRCGGLRTGQPWPQAALQNPHRQGLHPEKAHHPGSGRCPEPRQMPCWSRRDTSSPTPANSM